MNKLIILFLILGIIYRLFLTSEGNFIFNMDNARDFVDVREMMTLKKIRLTGPASAVEGIYNGPAWYYILAVPYILTGGDPYGGIVMEIILWALGGYFLFKLTKKYGLLAILLVGTVWVTSNFILLQTAYTFNPNPVTLLAPVFIYLIFKYFENKKLVYISLAWILAGLFFNFEMNYGIFMPVIILAATFLVNKRLILSRTFWLGSIFFVLLLLPQLLFDLKHQFIMTKSFINFLSQSHPDSESSILKRVNIISTLFYGVLAATLSSFMEFVKIILAIFVIIMVLVFRNKSFKNYPETIIALSMIFIPFFGYVILPVNVNSWHLGGAMAAAILIAGFLIGKTWGLKFYGKSLALILIGAFLIFSAVNVKDYIGRLYDPNLDPSSFKNELQAVDFVYQKSGGKNFKAYTYLPSVYDYPYQYLFWWYGNKKYGFIPGEYAYSPGKPAYIPSQDKFQGRKDNLSGLVFLIKEPDRIKMRQAWENDYKNMQFISKEMVGPLEVEIRKER